MTPLGGGWNTAHPGNARFSAFHSMISVQSTPQTHPSAQKLWRHAPGREGRKPFATNDLHVCATREYLVSVQTGRWVAKEPWTSPPSELAANPLGGELFELKSHQAMDLRVGKKLAAKCLCQQGPPEWGFCRHAPLLAHSDGR